MRKSSLERYQDLRRPKIVEPKEVEGLEGFLGLLLGGPPNPTQLAFICDDARVRAYKGPAGCAKTTTLCAAGMLRALLLPGSKGLIARHDYNDLMDTTARTLEEMLQRLPPGTRIDRDKSPPMKWWIQPLPQEREDGTFLDTPSEITFMGLKEAVGSYEFNWVAIDEADEVEENRVFEFLGRLRLNRENITEEDFSIMLAFNPPDKTHWLYRACTGRNPKDEYEEEPRIKLFEPKPRENVHNLRKGYYEDMAKGMLEDQKQRLIDGEWGSTFTGQPVYREFRERMHGRAELPVIRGSPVLRFWDFGYRAPVCLWVQVDKKGRLLVQHETQGKNEEAPVFIEKCLQKTRLLYPEAQQFFDFGDPAVKQKKDTGSTLALFMKAGILMRYRQSRIEEGVRTLRLLLERLIDGEPAFQISTRNCPLTTVALKGGYRMDDAGLKPLKDGTYDHVADALRYGVLNLFGDGSANAAANIAAYVAMDSDGDWAARDSLEYDPAHDTDWRRSA